DPKAWRVVDVVIAVVMAVLAVRLIAGSDVWG
ncbi:amino acid transporter, partial [Xanthomonas citri pv. citri]|nr:amino acid transporter [Xanthomonas citri pv. citri]